MQVQDLIKTSLRNLGIIASGETVPVDILTDSLSTLQSMLRMWSSRKINVFASTRESFSLTSGLATYTWGSGGNITTARPHQVYGAVIRDSGNQDHPVEIITDGEYRSISNKATTGRPDSLFYNPLYPLGYAYFYPVPVDAETVYIDSLKPFTETSSFDSITSTISFPPNYEEPIITNLSIRLAPQFGKTVSSEIAAIASSGFESIITLNSGNQVEPVSLSLPVTGASNYDINAG